MFPVYQFLSAQTVPSGFTVSAIASGWTQPVGAVFSSNGQKLFVWERSGKVYVCNRNGSGTYSKQTSPVIDISEEVGNWRDHGLLGFALDPQFSVNGNIYLLYNVDRHHLMKFGTPAYNANTNEYLAATIGRVTRYTTITSGSNLVTNYSTRKILIGETPQTGIPILYESHGIGTLVFAADSTLLVSAGDGASYNVADPGSIGHTYYVQALADGIIRPEENVGAFRSQLLNSHCGKLLRIDPATGDGLSSNPFYSASQPRSPKSRVWTLGLRNPFRVAIKPGTGSTNPSAGDIGEVSIGDVGWGTWEELSIVDKPGMNCGWPLFEGHTTLDSYYNLSTQNLDEPNPLYGTGGCTQQYFTFKNLLKQATADNSKTVFNPCNPSQAIGTNNRFFHRRPAIDWKHGEDNARVGIFSGNNASTALIGTPASNVTGTPFRGNAAVAGCWYSGTSFPAKYQNTFFQADYGGNWIKSFKIGFTDVLQEVQQFATGFTAIVAITVNPLDGSLFCTDIGNNTIKRIGYGGNQLPVVVMSSNKTFGPSVLNVNFTGNASYDPDGTITGYSWNFGDGSAVSTAANPSHNFTAPANTPKKFVVKLTVTDIQNGQSTDSIIISVNNTPPVVNITSPVKNSTYVLGSDTLYSCTATVTDDEHSGGQLTYAWQSFLRHNLHEHAEPVVTTPTTQTLISRIGCNGDTYYWMIKLTVTDAAGLSDTDSSMIFPQCHVALPVVLRTFGVTQQIGSNQVNWTTELEENIAFYEVERCQDGVHFQPIHKQLSRNIPSATTYSFDDSGFPQGVNYYRLKITEISGTVRYSLVVKIAAAKEDDNRLLIVPNPVTNEFSVSYTAANRGTAIIQIWDANGNSLQTVKQIVMEGSNVIYLKASDSWSSGVYYITLQKGEVISRTKFFKIK